MPITRVRYSACVLAIIFGLSIFTFLPNIAIAETEWKIYKLSYEGQVFKMPYRMSTGDIQHLYIPPLSLGPATGGIFIQLENDTKDGTLEITVSMELVHEGFVIYVDEKSTYWRVVNGSPCSVTYLIKFPAHSNVISMRYLGYGVPTHPIYSVYVTTEKVHYKTGERVRVSGCTSLALDDKMVTLEFLSPNGEAIGKSDLIPDSDGSFSFCIGCIPPYPGLNVLQPTNLPNGTLVKATYAGHSATTSFVVPEFPVVIVIISIAIGIMLYFSRFSMRRGF